MHAQLARLHGCNKPIVNSHPQPKHWIKLVAPQCCSRHHWAFLKVQRKHHPQQQCCCEQQQPSERVLCLLLLSSDSMILAFNLHQMQSTLTADWRPIASSDCYWMYDVLGRMAGCCLAKYVMILDRTLATADEPAGWATQVRSSVMQSKWTRLRSSRA